MTRIVVSADTSIPALGPVITEVLRVAVKMSPTVMVDDPAMENPPDAKRLVVVADAIAAEFAR